VTSIATFTEAKSQMPFHIRL